MAVSGGLDSVALWALLADAGRWDLTVWHLDHGIRPESFRDAELIRALPLPGWRLIEQADIPALARVRRCGLEEAGRRHRYARLAEVAAEVGAPVVVTAHHRDDQAETILHNLLRGSHGLVGMPAQRALSPTVRVVRPLLAYGKAELRAWLVGRGLPWCEDATNADPIFARNRIRHHVLSTLAAGCPDIASALVAAAGSVRDEPPLRRWLRDRQLPVSRAIMARLAALAPGGRTTLGGRLITRTVDGWSDAPEHPEVPPAAPIPIRPATVAELAAPHLGIVVAGTRGELVCRLAQAGERWRPLGASGSQTVFDSLAARRVPARDRPAARVVADADGPVWVEHCTIAERCRVTADTLNGWKLLVRD